MQRDSVLPSLILIALVGSTVFAFPYTPPASQQRASDWAVQDILDPFKIQVLQSTTAHVVINEAEQNPAGTDEGTEWVELHNPTSSEVDISGWKVSTTAGVTVTTTIPSGTKIPAGGYYIVTYRSQWLDNEGESVVLRDSTGDEVDRTPSLNDTYDDGRSWQRYPNG